MARNRKNQAAGIRFGPVMAAFVVCLVLGGSGVGYVWQKEQIDELGEQFKAREVRLGRLAAENEQRRKQLWNMRSPAYLEARVKELNLGLVAPHPSQVWRLSEPVPERPTDNRPQSQYAADNTRITVAQ